MNIKAIIQFIIEHYEELFSFTAATIFIIISFISSYNNRDRLAIKFNYTSIDLPGSFKDFTKLIQNKLLQITQTHLETSEAASDLNVAIDIALPPSGEALNLTLELEKHIKKQLKPVIKLLTIFFKWLFRPPKIIGDIFLSNIKRTHNSGSFSGDLKIDLRYIPRKKNINPISIEPVIRKGIVDKDLEGLSNEIAYKILLANSGNRVTTFWHALQYITEGLVKWPKTTMHSKLSAAEFDESETKFKEALNLDRNCALANYNLGLISYLVYGSKHNDKAINYFKQTSLTTDKRFYYLGKIGLVRCYCQNYHRYGKQSKKDLLIMRTLSNEIIDLIFKEKKNYGKREWEHFLKIDYARALYCRAFAYHVTEEYDDIKKGIEDYLRILRLYCHKLDKFLNKNPDKLIEGVKILKDNISAIMVPAVIYNNLAYILMARGGRFCKVTEESESDYKLARYFLELATMKDPEYKFAFANLGNIERLLKNYSAAKEFYYKALEIDPNYPNGYSELSWVYLENNEKVQSQKMLKKAIKLAASVSQKCKIKEYYGRILYCLGRKKESLEYIKSALVMDKKCINQELRDWLKSTTDLKELVM